MKRLVFDLIVVGKAENTRSLQVDKDIVADSSCFAHRVKECLSSSSFTSEVASAREAAVYIVISLHRDAAFLLKVEI